MSTKTIASLCLLAGSVIAWGQACKPPAESAVVAYPSGTILPDIGTTDMPVSTKNIKAKELAKQGFALIHCYWPNEAIRSFRDATKLDPTCAIAWCGLNIALTQPWFTRSDFNAEAEYAIKKAIANVESASEAEQDLIRAFRLRSIGKDDRGSEFEKALQSLIDKHPKLDEPRLLWAGIRAQLCMGVNYLPNGDPRTDLEFVIKLVEPVIKRNPKSAGALHYWIHACEPATPKRAEKAADDLQKIAKGSPHMVHMSGHLYNRVGRYEDGQKVFSRAKAMDEELAKKLNVSPGQAIWQYYHNVSFQVMNILELGRIAEATELVKIAKDAKGDIAVRVRDWKNAYDAKRSDPDGLANKNVCLARLDLEMGNVAAARAKIDEAKKEIEKGEPKGRSRTSYRLLATVVKETEGLVLSAEGKTDEAVKALQDSIRAFHTVEYEEPVFLIQIPYETLGQILTHGKRYDDAVKAYEDGLKVRPNSGWLLFGIGKAHEEAGRSKDAEKAYQRFLKAWTTADRDRPEIKHAEEFLATSRKPR
ncbi:MAG: tetratricopeptide repeat protein [Chlorobia bacterium]|nr:tetratricopeptide repeat protein [Fimbriimonadaceae bacterium]